MNIVYAHAGQSVGARRQLMTAMYRRRLYYTQAMGTDTAAMNQTVLEHISETVMWTLRLTFVDVAKVCACAAPPTLMPHRQSRFIVYPKPCDL
jgi:hypothetical protein